MKKVIYKYSLALAPSQRLTLPYAANILSVQVQGNNIYLWALFNQGETSTTDVHVQIAPTGQVVTDISYTDYFTTVQLAGAATHIFISPY